MAGTGPRALLGATVLPTPRGGLVVTNWSPPGKCRGSVLFVPPFAEEMNKCRPMLARTGQLLAAAGLRAHVIDLFGTGDSAGEFRDARLEYWRDDLVRVADRMRRDGDPLMGLVGVRFGALLALELSALLPGLPAVALWQPVTSGQQQLMQFLRLRVAGGLLTGGGTESAASLLAELQAGTILEVAGYELHPDLARDLGVPDIRSLAPPVTTRLAWFEIGAGERVAPSMVAADRLRDWQTAGIAAQGVLLTGDPFWSTVEVTLCPSLAEQTVSFLGAAA